MARFKSSLDIQKQFIDLIRGTQLAEEVTGRIYHAGHRAKDSVLEDIVVTFTTGVPAEIEEGVVTIHVYVSDISPNVYDGERMMLLMHLSNEMVEEINDLNSDYFVELANNIHMMEDFESDQHLIVIRLRYKYYNN